MQSSIHNRHAVKSYQWMEPRICLLKQNKEGGVYQQLYCVVADMRGEAVAQLTNGDFCHTFVQYQQPCDVENIPIYLVRLTPRIVQIHQSLGFLSQGLRNAVGDICLYTIYSCRPRRFRFFLRHPVVHHGHSCRLLRVYIVQVVVATQALITQRYLLPVLQTHSSDDRFNFVVETSNDVFDRVCRRLRSECLQQPLVHQSHFHGVHHLL